QGGDWGVHAIGHQLSFLYDTPHGATLSIAYPAWLKLQKNRIPDRIKALGKGLFDTNSVDDTIMLLSRFFTSLKSPVNLSDINLGLKNKSEILEQLNKSRASGLHHVLNKEDHLKLVNFMM
ncbi:MAG: iron-containing alcohol dehydrogenase, partial [Bacteroidota bacterium]|nr:iron-containing alcohol dehydrogenase [Bacteroidota bacterium]